MIIRYILAMLVVLPGYSWAVTLYSPFCSSPCQTTKGPGSYGKSPSDVRYRDAWQWNQVPCNTPSKNSRTPRCAAKSSALR